MAGRRLLRLMPMASGEARWEAKPHGERSSTGPSRVGDSGRSGALGVILSDR
jgi:hypothetical protein